MRSYLYVLSLSHLILITARIAVSIDTSCSDDQDCFPSGGRKCCLDKCSGRKYCENYCTSNTDCDMAKRENCTGNKCATEVRNLKLGNCQYSYECNNLTEICEQGVCKETKGAATMIPKSSVSEKWESSNSLAAVLAATIIPAVIVMALIIGVCCANHKIRAIQRRPSRAPSDDENIQT